MKFVLDASALIAFFDAEDGGLEIADLLLARNTRISIHSVNLCEAFYHFLRKDDESAANTVLRDVLSFGIEIRDEVDPKLWKFAAHLKSKYKPLSLGDSFGVAFAKMSNGIFVSSDHRELDPLDRDGVCKFFFFR